jgi:hypothetical protein
VQGTNIFEQIVQEVKNRFFILGLPCQIFNLEEKNLIKLPSTVRKNENNGKRTENKHYQIIRI